jgi:hypothetical protein
VATCVREAAGGAGKRATEKAQAAKHEELDAVFVRRRDREHGRILTRWGFAERSGLASIDLKPAAPGVRSVDRGPSQKATDGPFGK